MIRSVRNTLKALPLGIAVSGRRTAAFLRLLDGPLKASVSEIQRINETAIHIDPSHRPERLVAYAFFNLKRYYSTSPLGRLIIDGARHGSFVDVGANLGFYSLLAREVGMCSYAIEVEPRHADFLQRNSHVFGAVIRTGLSDAPGNLPIYYNTRNPGATSLYESGTRSSFTVEVDTFSRLAERGEMGDQSRIAVVKIDVEGEEAAVVRGMVDFLTIGNRPLIWCEVRGDRSMRNGGSYREVTSVLEKFGYRSVDVAERESSGRVGPMAEREIFDLMFVPL